MDYDFFQFSQGETKEKLKKIRVEFCVECVRMPFATPLKSPLGEREAKVEFSEIPGGLVSPDKQTG